MTIDLIFQFPLFRPFKGGLYNITVPQEGQKIRAVKVPEIQKPLRLPHKTEVFLSPQTLTAGIF